MSNALTPKPRIIGPKVRICIVASKYNEQYTDALVENAIEELGELVPQGRLIKMANGEGLGVNAMLNGTTAPATTAVGGTQQKQQQQQQQQQQKQQQQQQRQQQ